MAEAGIAGYYDRLDRWNKLARFVGYGGGRRTLTVHRGLADPRHGNKPTATRLHDLLASVLPPLAGLSVLDAGCGLGGTMLDLAARDGGTFVGLTLSPLQARVAEDAACEAGVADRVTLRVQSYDAPPAGPFDVVIAIESLAHSANPVGSLKALADVQRTGGVIVIVDDMPTDGGRGLGTGDRQSGVGSREGDLATFKAGWNCPVLLGRSEWLAALTSHGFRVVEDRDLTPECRPRTLGSIAALERLNRLAQRLVSMRAFRDVLHSHLGGLALERLLRTGGVQYRMLVARLERAHGLGENPQRC